MKFFTFTKMTIFLHLLCGDTLLSLLWNVLTWAFRPSWLQQKSLRAEL